MSPDEREALLSVSPWEMIGYLSAELEAAGQISAEAWRQAIAICQTEKID